jgi:hypothetical protein
MTETSTTLVIGATGIFAPAVQALAEQVRVVRVSYQGGDGSIPVDARDAGALAAALSDCRWDDALVYAPAVTDLSLNFVRAATTGRCVLVRTTAAADPARGILAVPEDTLQLGWSVEAPRRWHTPQAISALALEVLADGMPRTLGTVRPWSDRP